ncbi:hypothetical protein BZG36_00856 [Bifiguratus adelaidae]|uniref:SLA1 homology domain-containing protein n=1 Tax=Bifiguratus adelaidae TaxID=1938954 RepID=A0A261Y5R7_9FUNG|nr:hypothetical protein BZG36_00856 [Bifiguratus adelaidae]
MSKVREWRDLDGKFKQEAIFEGLFQRTKVKLRKVHNGAIVAIPLDRLRPEDRAYVEEQLNLAKVQPGGEKEYNEEDVSGPYSPGVGGGRPSSIAQPSLNTVMNDRIARYSLPVTTSQRTPESNGAVALNSSVANAVKSMPSTQPPQCAEMDVHSSTKLDLTYNKPEESHADQLGSKSHAYANADVAIPVPTSRAWRNQRNAGEPQPSGGFVSGSQFGNGLQNDAEQYPKDPIRPTEMDVNQLQLTHGFSAHAESALYGQQQTKSPVLPGQVPTDRSANEDSIPSSSLILDSGPILTSELLNTATAARSQQRASITPQRLSSYSRNSNYSYREDEDELDAEERSRLAKYRAEHPLPTVVPDSTQSTDYQTEDSFSVDQSKHSETERESSPITRMMGNENDMHNQYGAAPTVVINGGNDYLGNDFLPPLATSDDLLESVLEKARNLSVTSQSTDVSEGAKLGVSTETAEGMTADYGYVSSQSLSPAKTGSPVNAPSSLISPDSPLHITHLGPEIFIPLVQHLDIVTIVNLYSTSKSIRESFRRDPQCWHYMQFDPQHNEKVEHHFVRALIWWLNHHKVIQYVRDICYDGTLVQEVTVINTLEYFPALESLSIRGCYNVYSYPLANYLIQRAKHHNLPLPMLQTFLLGPSLHRGSIPQGFPIEMKPSLDTTFDLISTSANIVTWVPVILPSNVPSADKYP